MSETKGKALQHERSNVWRSAYLADTGHAAERCAAAWVALESFDKAMSGTEARATGDTSAVDERHTPIFPTIKPIAVTDMMPILDDADVAEEVLWLWDRPGGWLALNGLYSKAPAHNQASVRATHWLPLSVFAA